MMDKIKKTMKVAVYYNNNKVDLEERPVPEIGPGELLVKTEACGLCGGETMEWYLASRAPKILGHEPTGVVVKTGAGVTKFKEGDRVFAHHHVGCMSCHYCNRGLYSLCEKFGKTNLHPGAFAEYFRVPADNADLDTLILPDSVSFEDGTIIEPMACVLKGFNDVKIHPGDTMAVIGTGFMGLSFVQLARLYPFAKIVALDLNDWRLEKAKEMGATHTINPGKENAPEVLRSINNGRLADFVAATVPTASIWNLGLSLCGKGATFHVNAPAAPDDRVQINPNELYFKEIKINSAYSATHLETRAILDLLADGRVDAKSLITHRFGLHQVVEAIQMLLASGESLKSLVVPSLTEGL
jgi:L-iditol 2-dehydrogenase